ncbi:hypothetical protein L873DRAFT_1787784 [Choiromyces venosus 120613-1]|uniref:Uncharacterized protein n=1 Tax=Choiromyces venosus 120613-1 TaxID=1336337 RepID=A0A3N4JZD4_9PEZI|nr:hypothetical protein L873DRAFT_1787784 [Choiromyces venosus 120613-1]
MPAMLQHHLVTHKKNKAESIPRPERKSAGPMTDVALMLSEKAERDSRRFSLRALTSWIWSEGNLATFVSLKYSISSIQRTLYSPVMSSHIPSLTRFFTRNRSKSTLTSSAGPSTEKPYYHVPSNAAASFLASTTPVTLEERYHQKPTTPHVPPVKTLSEKSEDMRRFGRSRTGAITIGFTTAA